MGRRDERAVRHVRRAGDITVQGLGILIQLGAMIFCTDPPSPPIVNAYNSPSRS